MRSICQEKKNKKQFEETDGCSYSVKKKNNIKN